MGLFTDQVQKTSVSVYIERLSNLEEVDWYLLQQLSESIQMQTNGGREAIETVRKKLKHGDTQQKLRVLEVLKLLMENSSAQFHKQFLANEKMKERFEMMLNSSSEDPVVKKELLSLLRTWATKYKEGMRSYNNLYEQGKGKRAEQTSQSDLNQAGTKEEKRESEQDKAKGSSRMEGPFDFERSKPKVIEEIALANQNSNNFKNALQLINTSEDRWEIELRYDPTIQEHRHRCEESRKKIVHYARLVENEEWIGTLLAANEELLKGLDMYETMSAGQVPAVWSPTNTIRAPPVPPLLSGSNKQDPLDPFADPSTPVEEKDFL